MIPMARFKQQFAVLVVLVMAMAMVLLAGVLEAARTPPGIANNPSHATCKDPSYKECHNLVHVCPKFCPDSCTVHCQSCKPICGPGDNPPPEQGGGGGDDDGKGKGKGGDDDGKGKGKGKGGDDDGKGKDKGKGKGDDPTPTPPARTPPTPSIPSYPPPQTQPPSTPPPTAPTTPSPSPPPPSTPSTPPPSTPSPTPPSSTPPSSPPTTPSPTPSTPSTPPPSTPSPTPPSGTPPSSPPTTPSPTPSTPNTPPPSTPSPTPPSGTPPSSPSTPTTPSPSTPSPPSSETAPATARCRNNNFPQCFNLVHKCPEACPGGCEVDCVTCKPVCKCDRPGAVCQDPRFIGGDGITFYFHGKKDRDFCLVSDSNLHINAHFIGRRNENMKRDFTWVQSIAVLFDNHQLFIGALKTATWDESIDRLAVSFDGEPITLPETHGSRWESTNVSISRPADQTSNNVVIEVAGKFKITAKVVPITEEDSRIHNYGITKDDCFAHLDLGFKFHSLSDQVNGVLGQTYRPSYATKVSMGAKMPAMGGDREFATSSLFAADCAVARFSGSNNGDESTNVLELPGLSCASGIDGKGVVCRR